jgi:hypothetical protein
MMPDVEAREVVRAAFAKRGMDAPVLAELQGVQAIGRFEGRYGSWKGANNWGAVQCGKPPCPPDCFAHVDTDASGKTYDVCFRRYTAPVDGAADLVRELYRRAGVPEGMAAGNADTIAERMRATGYFEGPPAMPPETQYAKSIALYAKAIVANATQIALNLGEPLRVVRAGDKPDELTGDKAELADDDAGGGGWLLALGALGLGYAVWRRSS